MAPSRSKPSPRPPRKSIGRGKRTLRSETSPVVEAFSAPEPVLDHEQIVSPDEKRELILAHASMRRPHDPVQLLSVWAGVAATFVVIVGAWWWSTKPEYLRIFSTPLTSGLEPMVQDAKDLGSDISDISSKRASSLSQELEKAAARLDALDRESRLKQGAVTRMTSLIEAASAATSTIK